MMRTPKERAQLVLAGVPTDASFHDIQEWLEAFEIIAPRPAHGVQSGERLDIARSNLSETDRDELRDILFEEFGSFDEDDIPF